MMLGVEPGKEEAPRVARVEASADSPTREVSRGELVRDELVSKEARAEGSREPEFTVSAEGPRRDLADTMEPRDQDDRELIPVELDKLGRMENLLLQVMEENKSLKRRLEVESRSHSSWYSGGMAPEQPFSPATFGQRAEDVHRFLSADFPGSSNAGIPSMGFSGAELVHEGVFRGGPHSWSGQRFEVQPEGLGPGNGFRAFGPGFRGPLENSSHVHALPPPPLPLPPAPVVEATPAEEPPQTMTQFTEGMLRGSGFQTPRANIGTGVRVDAQGYPLSPGGTVIRPPPTPPSTLARAPAMMQGAPDFGGLGRVPEGDRRVQGDVRPEEPAKYISELPKLSSADLASSAVVCGNWLAQVRQIFQGLSPTADVWFTAVELAASQGYHKWLTADPLGRLALDPGSIVAAYDQVRFQRVESRAVSLLLASLPAAVKDDIIMNRWLSTSAILFRILCLYQPGGSSERAHLLSQLVTPDVCKSFPEAVKILRKWQQSMQRAAEVGAALPDASLLLKGVDSATGPLLSSNPMIAFRVNSFRHSVALDYNPTTLGVTQLVRLLQAESEAVALVDSSVSSDKRAKAAALSMAKESGSVRPPPPPPPKVAAEASVASIGAGSGDKKGKGKGKASEGTAAGCYKFADGSGCKFGDACMFKHDRSKARKDGRCLACGQAGHFRPDCPLVAPENRPVVSEQSSEGSPSSAGGRAKAKAKAKSGAQAKGITEEKGDKGEATAGNASGAAASLNATVSQEALVAEAAKLLKGVSLRALTVAEVDSSWLRSALASASDPEYCLVDSGATKRSSPR